MQPGTCQTTLQSCSVPGCETGSDRIGPDSSGGFLTNHSLNSGDSQPAVVDKRLAPAGVASSQVVSQTDPFRWRGTAGLSRARHGTARRVTRHRHTDVARFPTERSRPALININGDRTAEPSPVMVARSAPLAADRWRRRRAPDASCPLAISRSAWRAFVAHQPAPPLPLYAAHPLQERPPADPRGAAGGWPSLSQRAVSHAARDSCRRPVELLSSNRSSARRHSLCDQRSRIRRPTGTYPDWP